MSAVMQVLALFEFDSLTLTESRAHQVFCLWDSPGVSHWKGVPFLSPGVFPTRDRTALCVWMIARSTPEKLQKTLQIISYFHKSCVRGEICKSNVSVCIKKMQATWWVKA